MPDTSNRFCRRTGNLWESRYNSSLVQAETYLLACYRCIELDSVRVGMVTEPGQFRWSSDVSQVKAQADFGF